MKSAENVVLIQCGDHFENQERILPLALDLRSRGLEVIPMMYGRELSSRIFEVHGFSPLYLNEVKDSLGSVFQKLEPAVLEDIVRVERQRSPSRYWPGRIAAEYSKVTQVYRTLEYLLNSFVPVLVGVWNGHTGHVANCLRVLTAQKNMNRFFMERSVFEGALFVDTLGVNGDSSISRMTDLDMVSFERFSERVPSIKGVGDAVDWELPEVVRGKKIIFLPMQVQTDTNNILYSDHVKGMRRFVLAAIQAVEEMRAELKQDIVLVVRRHPEEVDVNLNLPGNPFLYYLNSGPISEWCRASSAILTINSTVGLEGICVGAPVISVGRSIYSGKGITLDVDLVGISEALRKVFLESWSPDGAIVKKYLESLYFTHTASEFNFPSVLSSVTGGGVFEGKSSVYSAFSGNDSSKDEINIAVFARKIPVLNLTYRNTRQTLDRNFILKWVSQRAKGMFPKVNVRRVVSFEGLVCDVLIIPRTEYRPGLFDGIGEVLVLDEYFLPVNIT